MEYLYSFLSWVMNGCYGFCHNYGAAIVLFTFCSKKLTVEEVAIGSGLSVAEVEQLARFQTVYNRKKEPLTALVSLLGQFMP